MNKRFNVLTLIGVFSVFAISVTTLVVHSQRQDNQPQNVIPKGNQISMTSLEVNNNLQKYGVEVIHPTDVNFNIELMRYLGGNNVVLPLVETASPLVFFIKNKSNKEIIGISLRWNVVKTDGNGLISPQMVSAPGVLMGIKPRDPWMVGKTSLINNNDVMIFSYFDIVSQFVLRNHQSFKYPNNVSSLGSDHIQQAISYVQSRKALMRDFLNASVSIDGVLFKDGAFIGDDQNFFFDSISGMIQARKDFRQKLKEGKGARKNDSEILDQFVADLSINPLNSEKEQSPYFADRKDAFERSHKSTLFSMKTEIIGKRKKANDKFIINDFLSPSDSEIIFPRKLR